MACNHAGQLVQYTGSALGGDNQADPFAQIETSYFFSNSPQTPRAFKSTSTTSRTAPAPPGEPVTTFAEAFTSARAFAVAKERPTRRIMTTSVKSSPT